MLSAGTRTNSLINLPTTPDLILVLELEHSKL